MEPNKQLYFDILNKIPIDRIDISQGRFTAVELNPTPKEIHERVYRTINEFQPEYVNF